MGFLKKQPIKSMPKYVIRDRVKSVTVVFRALGMVGGCRGGCKECRV